VVDHHFLVFQLLVVFEEIAQFLDAMGRQLPDRGVVAVFGVVGVDGDDLVVGLALVAHHHHADGAHLEDGQGHDRLLAQHQDVQRILVGAVAAGDEAVVGRIMDARKEHTVDADHAAGFIEFVFYFGAFGDLDDGREVFRQLVAVGQIVPWIHWALLEGGR